ncbi:MAG TPA: hypothetical protein VK991_00940 [Halomonas sp.]|nr:hypothetical protein [Halomonas sp.]
MNEQVLFIVWRESVEAILVVGIAYAWLKQSESRTGLRYLWLVVLGLLRWQNHRVASRRAAHSASAERA